jgi:hypothetical protein
MASGMAFDMAFPSAVTLLGDALAPLPYSHHTCNARVYRRTAFRAGTFFHLTRTVEQILYHENY